MTPLQEFAPGLARSEAETEHPFVALDWDDLRYVLALRSAGSLGGAARQMKVEQSTASRRLSAVEASLGVHLVSRTPEGVVLNDAGQLVADLAQTIEAGIADLSRRIGGEDHRPEGLVRLATSESFTTFLMGGLVPLHQEHPKIQVQLVVSSAALDLVRREADVALRLFRETSPTLVSRKIGEVGWSIYCSPDYLARSGLQVGAMPGAAMLAGQAVVGFAGATGRSAGGLWLSEHCRSEDVVLTGGSVTSVANAVRAGLGLSVLPCFAAAGDAALVRLTPEVVTTAEAYLVIPPDHRDTARVRVVTEALAALFERERTLLSGSPA